MKNFLYLSVVVIGIIGCAQLKNKDSNKTENTEEVMGNTETNPKDQLGSLKLGAFSQSLSVKDLAASKEFYEKLGFEKLGGDVKMNYLIMKNDNAIIGLFQGMFEGNIMTFNPGWDENGENIEEYTDVRLIQKHLKSKGVELDVEADETTTGPANIILKDPDGNLIFLDQHR